MGFSLPEKDYQCDALPRAQCAESKAQWDNRSQSGVFKMGCCGQRGGMVNQEWFELMQIWVLANISLSINYLLVF